MIRRKKVTIFTDAKDTTTVKDLKRMVQGIVKVPPRNQQLYKDGQAMTDDKQLAEFGITMSSAKAQSPLLLQLAYRLDNGEFEELDVTPYSSPPDLPEVMRNQEANGQEQIA